jgi:enamine deaminase RidA (YjgF/YER057c/UK114 family)
MAREDQVQYYNEPVERSLGFAAIVRAGPTLHLAGILAADEQMQIVAPGDMAGQIARIYDVMEATLAKCGATLEHVVNEMMYVTDMAALAAGAPVRVARYAKCAPPAATVVQIGGLFVPEALIEIHATAHLPEGEWSADVAPSAPPI